MGGPGEGVGGPGARRGEGPFRPDVVRKRLRCSGASLNAATFATFIGLALVVAAVGGP